MAVFLGAIKTKYKFKIFEILGTNEESGQRIFGPGKLVSISRTNYNSASNYIKSKYSYQKTGKHYFIEGGY
jgi:hypothetical protein